MKRLHGLCATPLVPSSVTPPSSLSPFDDDRAYVNARTSPVIVMAFYPLQAVLTPIFSAIFLGTKIGTTDSIGGAIGVGGLALCISGRQLEGNVRKVSMDLIALSSSRHAATSSGALEWLS